MQRNVQLVLLGIISLQLIHVWLVPSSMMPVCSVPWEPALVVTRLPIWPLLPPAWFAIRPCLAARAVRPIRLVQSVQLAIIQLVEHQPVSYVPLSVRSAHQPQCAQVAQSATGSVAPLVPCAHHPALPVTQQEPTAYPAKRATT